MHELIDSVASDENALPGLIRALQDLHPAEQDAVRVDQIRLLEELKSAAAAAQAKVTAAFVGSQRAEQRTAGIPEERCERGIAAQVALAKRTSPFRARRYVGWARILTAELPATFAQLQAGRTTEWRAMLVARETAWLSREHRAVVDAELAPRLEQLGDKRVEAETKTVAYRLDPDGYVGRLRNAESERRVSLRPAPDVMARLSALLPVREGVATHVALTRAADTLIAAGDPRSRGQIMADLLVQRVTGQATANAGGVPVEVSLSMDADTLLAPHDTSEQPDVAPGSDQPAPDQPGPGDEPDNEPGPEQTDAGQDDPGQGDARDRAGTDAAPGRDEPAYLHGYGPIPAPLARSWLLDPDRSAPIWLRRLFTRPDTGQLIGMESRRRLFTPAQARYIRLRDQTCRTPWCEAPIRHTDHITPAEDKGPTSVRNGQGLCVACNHAKQAPGWHARTGPAATAMITTPTGHRYTSRAPDPPGHPPPPRDPVEQHLAELLHVA